MKRWSQNDVREACQMWLDAINARVPIKSNEVIWSNIHQKLGKPDITPHQLKAFIEERTGHLAVRGRWYTWYQAALKHSLPHTLTSETWDGLEQALDARRIGFVFYFRALDRTPGGNTDIRVLKFTLDHEYTFNFQHMHCCDGYFLRSTHPFLLPSPEPEAFEMLVESVYEVLKARNSQSFEFTIDDPQQSTEVGDTLWSSVEVMVFAPWGKVGPGEQSDDVFPPDPELTISGWPLVARVHQRALCRNWLSDKELGDHNVPFVSATQAHQELMDNVRHLVGLGSPQEFNDGETMLNTILNNNYSRGYWAFTTRMQPETGPNILPIYLRTPK